MKVLITGICGFAGTSIANTMVQSHSNLQIFGLDNFSRKGSELNISELKDLGIQLIRGDIRSQSDIDALPKVDWVIDCAANPSVLAGIDGQSSSRQLMEHNLLGTINLLEYCKNHMAGLILLSTSRVYSASELATLPVESSDYRFDLRDCDVRGATSLGISEDFPTTAPLSLYGASKLASETLILEYGECFDFPVWINRCGVLAGAGQFGKADQGIFSFWIHSFREKRPLKYIGFNGTGHQVRDALHPRDLVPLLYRQMLEPDWEAPKIINLGGGIENSMSLKELSSWCEDRFGQNEVLASQDERPMDAPWIVMDSTTAQNAWNWSFKTKIEQILEEIANYAEKNPGWSKLC
ncbi:MAG: NAD-dependent epimerase/dehydratase family protein [Verrucomicrobia bacterium]|nr:NAD-dependent epimerase/dehydratase family protein [Verrucomicrobiota bacterium]